jgi:hypothetical protein
MLKLLTKLPDDLEQARKLLNRVKPYWQARGTNHGDVTLFFRGYIEVYPLSDAIELMWQFKVLLAKNVYTDEVYGLMRDKNYLRSAYEVWGLCRLAQPKSLNWSGKDDYVGYSGTNAPQGAYERWIVKLTSP